MTAKSRRNPPRPATQMRAGSTKVSHDQFADAAARVGATWRQMRDSEPLMVELLLPEQFRRDLDALAEVTE